MAKAKSASGTTRLVHTGGATVVVPSDKAARLLAGVGFSEAKQAAPKPAATKSDQ